MMQKSKATPKQSKFNINMNIDLSGVSQSDILLFTKHLGVALKSGVTLLAGLEMLEEQSTGKLKKVIRRIIESIQSGRTFHESLALYPKYFSPIYINLVKTGEVAGTLEKNLLHLAKELKKSEELRQKVKSAMMYPMMVLVAVIGLGLSVAIFVLPKIVPLFNTLNVDLPTSTRLLMWVAAVFGEHAVLIVIVIMGGSILLGWILRRNIIKPITHRITLKLPVIKKIIVNINMQRFTQTLGTLLASGVPVDMSLKITADSTENRVYKKAIQGILPEVQKGNKIATALQYNPKLFPKISVHMLTMSENTGNLDETLTYLSEFYEGEVNNTMKNLSTILEPALLIVIGIMVGSVAIAILGPIYKITGSLRG